MSSFYIYALIFRLAIISVGVFAIYIGYRLFVMGVMPRDGSEINAEIDAVQLSVKNAAPGTCFALFGVFVICMMLIQGNPEYKISFNDKQGTFSVRGNEESVNSVQNMKPTKLTEEQIKEINSLTEKLISNQLIRKEAAEPLLRLATIYYSQQWYDNAMVLTNLVITLNSNNLNDANQLKEKIKKARGY